MNKRLPFKLLPRKKASHKGDFGHTLVVAGSPSYRGAAILASRAASVAGSGLVTLAVTKRLLPYFSRTALPETMFLPLAGSKADTPSYASLRPILDYIGKRRVTSLVIGPGLTRDFKTVRLIRALTLDSPVPVVLDADGLSAFRNKTSLLARHCSELVLTPHAGEFGRLFKTQPPEDFTARSMLAKKLSRIYHCVLVLKGHETLVASENKVYRNKSGNPGMAKGGSGDVLSGVIAAFISQGLDIFSASIWAVFFHGLAGDIAVRMKGELALLPSDVIEALPRAFRKRVHSLSLS